MVGTEDVEAQRASSLHCLAASKGPKIFKKASENYHRSCLQQPAILFSNRSRHLKLKVLSACNHLDRLLGQLTLTKLPETKKAASEWQNCSRKANS